MAMRQRSELLTAMTRFGLGPSPEVRKMAGSDPIGYVLAQCAMPEAAMLTGPGLLPSYQFKQRRKQLKRERSAAKKRLSDGIDRGVGKSREEALKQEERAAARAVTGFSKRQLKAEIRARIAHQTKTEAPFVERLVLFWSNHFSIQTKRRS